MNLEMQWSTIAHQLPQLAKGLLFTLQISFTAYLCSLIGGLIIAFLRMSSMRLLSGLAFAYTQFFRAISIYIYIIWIYFGLAMAAGINLSPFVASVVSISLLHSAYLSEVYRSAIRAIELGQKEAAFSLGMGRLATFRDVVFPQALAIAAPQLVSQFAMIIKDSSIVALIGASDLMYETIRAANLEYRSFEFYSVAAIIYLAFVVIVSRLGGVLERRLKGEA